MTAAAVQEALFVAPAPRPAPATQRAAYIEVNEVHLLMYGTRATGAWWARFRQAFDRGDRITTTVIGFLGDRVRVACEDDEHARWLYGRLIEEGVAKAALKIGSGP